MKILIINTIEFNRNGMSTMIMNYYKNFDHKKISVDFLVNKKIDDEYKKIIEQNNDQIFVFENRNRAPLSYIKMLKNLASKNKYDIVYVHGNSATMAAEEFALQKTDSKIIVHAHGETTDHPLLHKMLYPYFIKHYTDAFAASEGAGRFLFKDKPFKVIKNGIDGNEFIFNQQLREEFRKKWHIQNSKVILQVGAFTPQKNHQFTIDIFKKLIEIEPDFKLLLAGDGPLKSEIESMVKDLHLENNVIFLGEVSNLAKIYSAADYLIFPSAWEPFGIVALEGQMSGLPVFVSDAFSKSVAVTQNITFLPLKESEWVKALSNSSGRDGIVTTDKKLINSLKTKGYDIRENACELTQLFDNIIEI